MENKKFKIDVDYLKQLRDMIAGVDHFMFEEDLDNLDCFIYRITHGFKDDKDGRNYMSYFRDNIDDFHRYKEFYPFVRKLFNSYLVFNRTISPNYCDLVLRDKDALDIAREFFDKHGSFFSDSLNDFIEDDVHDHLEFIEPSKFTEGEMSFVKSTGDAFVVVPDYDNITKTTILFHELEHVIDCFNNPKFFDNRIIRECSSMFMELIGTDFVGNMFNLNRDADFRKLCIHSIIKLDSRYIYFKNQLLYLGNKHKDLNSNNLKRRLHSYGYDIDRISSLNDTYLSNDYYYQISYLIAVELYMLYLNDKKRALYCLRYIIMNCNDNNIISELNKLGISLNSNMIEYEKGLDLKLSL